MVATEDGYHSSVSVCRSSSLRSNLGQHPEASVIFGQGENSFWRFPPSQQHMENMLTLHLSHHPSFHPVLNQTPHTSHPHPLTLEEGSKHDCNYNQTHTLCSVTRHYSPCTQASPFIFCLPQIDFLLQHIKILMACSHPPMPGSTSI